MAEQIFFTGTKDDLKEIIRASMQEVLSEIKGFAPPPAVEPDELFTTEQAATFTKTSRVTLLKWRKAGLIEAIFFGKSVRYRKSNLLKVSYSDTPGKNKRRKISGTNNIPSAQRN